MDGGKNERVSAIETAIFGRVRISASFSNEIKIKQAIIRSSNMKVAKFLLEGKIWKIKKALKLLLRGVGVERNNSRDSREALFFKNNVNP